MFGNKMDQTKQLEAQLQEKDRMIKCYEELFSQILSLQEDGYESFQRIAANRSEMDKRFERIRQALQKSKSNMEVENEITNQFAQRTQKITDQIAKSEESVSQFSREMEAEKDGMTAIVEGNKHFTSPSKNLLSEVSGLQVDLESLSRGYEKLRNYFQAVSVKSLQAAIEAGRMGDETKKFVEFTEEIRSLSEKNSAEIGEYRDSINQMKDRTRVVEEQVQKMNHLLKENNVKMAKIRQEHQNGLQNFKDAGYMKQEETMQLLLKKLGELRTYQMRSWEQEDHSMEEMEGVEKEFTEMHDSANEAEEIFRKIMKICQDDQENDLESQEDDTADQKE